jgi:hypothetical protein
MPDMYYYRIQSGGKSISQEDFKRRSVLERFALHELKGVIPAKIIMLFDDIENTGRFSRGEDPYFTQRKEPLEEDTTQVLGILGYEIHPLSKERFEEETGIKNSTLT